MDSIGQKKLERAKAVIRKAKREGRTVVKSIGNHFGDGWAYRLMLVRCGKKKCKCRARPLHGPYWYAEKAKGRKPGRGGKLGKFRIVTKYIGKKLKRVVDRDEELAQAKKDAA